MSTKRTICRALPALAFVLVAARPLAAQQLLAFGAVESRGMTVQAAERANQGVQSDTAAVVTLKSEATAVAMSNILPGGGQFYAGKYVKGGVLFGLTAVTAANAFGCDSAGEIGGCFPELGLFMVVSLGSWAVGTLTAAGDAREYNEKHARRPAVQPVVDRHAGRTGLGLALRY